MTLSPIPPPSSNLALTELSQLETSELRDELTRSLGMTAQHLIRLSWIVRLLEERGDDLSDLKIGMMDYLRRIAYGQLSPELVVRYAESPNLMRQLASLPLPDQVRFASGEPVMLVVRREDGRFDRRMADPVKLTRSQVRQVFCQGRIRDESEQILMLEDRPSPVAAEKIRKRKVGLSPDRQRGGLMVGRKFIAAGDVVSALAELMGELDQSPTDSGVQIKLTEAEHLALKNAANRASVSMNTLVRRALMIHGLFSGE